MTISFDELDLLMQQKNGAEKPEPSQHVSISTEFKDYLSQVTSNSAGHSGNAHAQSNYDLKPLSNHEMSRTAAPEFDLDQHYSQVHSMDITLGQGGQLPTTFEIGVRPQYELDQYA